MSPSAGKARHTPRGSTPSPREALRSNDGFLGGLTPATGITPLRPSAEPKSLESKSVDSDPRGIKNPALRGTGFSGLSQGVPLSHWLELVQIGRRDAVISLRTRNGDESYIWCRQGEIVDAHTGDLLGEDAVYQILEFEDGDVSIEFMPCERPKSIDTPTFALLLEASRRKDHAAESSGPRALPRFQSDSPPAAHALVPTLARIGETRITRVSSMPSEGPLSTTRPHVLRIDSTPMPSSTEWRHPRAFGVASAVVACVLGLWLIWPRLSGPRPLAGSVPIATPMAKPTPTPALPSAPPPPIASAPPPKAAIADEALPPEMEAPETQAPPEANEEAKPALVPAISRSEGPSSAEVVERNRLQRVRRPTHTPPPTPRPAPPTEASGSEAGEPAPAASAEAKKEEPRVRLIDDRKPRVQVIDEQTPDVRVIE